MLVYTDVVLIIRCYWDDTLYLCFMDVAFEG